MTGALELVDDEVVCDGVEGILPFADRLSARFDVLERSDLIAAFGDDTTAVLLHHDQTIPAPDAPAATHVTVADGRITQMHVRPRPPLPPLLLAAEGW
jgi:hypothetical protein